MHTRRFGRKLKLPSTVAIKHAILRLMVQDELKAQAPAAKAEEVSLLTAVAPLNTIATPC
jgi:hypothetical protein